MNPFLVENFQQTREQRAFDQHERERVKQFVYGLMLEIRKQALRIKELEGGWK
jgi:hypothetical protein